MKYKEFKKLSLNEMKQVKGGSVSPDCPICDTLRDCLKGYKCIENADGCKTCHRD